MSTPTTTANYTTKTGDTVDFICWQYYGTTGGGQVEAVLSGNEGLSGYGPILPAGVAIILPVIAPQPKQIRNILG